MSILEDMDHVLTDMGISYFTGVFKGKAPDTYLVIVPLTDSFDLHADNAPGYDIQEVRLSLYSKGNYLKYKNALVGRLLAMGFTITERRYIGYETETGYHHYAVDVAHYYEMEE